MDNKKILIADDEPNLVLALENLLTREGYSVLKTMQGREAVVLAKSDLPDLVILDVMMPDMDGAEVAEALKNYPSTADIPVLFLTAILSKEEEERLGRKPDRPYVYLSKPYDVDHLLNKVKQLIDSKTTQSVHQGGVL